MSIQTISTHQNRMFLPLAQMNPLKERSGFSGKLGLTRALFMDLALMFSKSKNKSSCMDLFEQGTWTCGKCNSFNNDSVWRCAYCGTDR